MKKLEWLKTYGVFTIIAVTLLVTVGYQLFQQPKIQSSMKIVALFLAVLVIPVALIAFGPRLYARLPETFRKPRLLITGTLSLVSALIITYFSSHAGVYETESGATLKIKAWPFSKSTFNLGSGTYKSQGGFRMSIEDIEFKLGEKSYFNVEKIDRSTKENRELRDQGYTIKLRHWTFKKR